MTDRRPIFGYEGLYEVDRDGRVYSLERTIVNIREYIQPEALVSWQPNQRGYPRVALWKNSKRKWHFVHRLVALLFIPNPHNYPLVNHKDENKQNPCDWNLEWATHAYNTEYSIKRVEEPQYSEAYNSPSMMSWTG